GGVARERAVREGVNLVDAKRHGGRKLTRTGPRMLNPRAARPTSGRVSGDRCAAASPAELARDGERHLQEAPKRRRFRGLPRHHPQDLQRTYLGGSREPSVEIRQVYDGVPLALAPRLFGELAQRGAEIRPAPAHHRDLVEEELSREHRLVV